MDKFWGLSGTGWTGIYTIITFCLLVVAVTAALYARKQWKEAREQVEEARKARVEASRPYVIVTIEPSAVSQQLFDLVVKNIGQRPALKVSIALDPAPKRARETAGHEISKVKMLNQPIALIAPGQEMRAFYDSHIERAGRGGLPSSHRVSLTYEDSSGYMYSEASFLDIEAMKGALFTSVRTIHDIGKSLEKMQETLAKASVLERSGKIQTETSIERRAEYLRRIAEETSQQREQHRQMLKKLEWDDADQALGAEPNEQAPPPSGEAGKSPDEG